jgi:intracellular multiplication protein IcmK
MKPVYVLATLLLTLGAADALAQGPAAPTPVTAPQPPSGLGSQVSSTTQPEPPITRPPPHEIVEQAIEDIESSQLTDTQFARIKRLYLRRERQKATPYLLPAKPVIRTLRVNLDPGMAPPVLRLTRGQLTSIVFSGVNGQPWTIKDVVLNRDLFSDGHESGANAQQSDPTNVLTLEPKAAAAYGSVSVRLKGLATPVIFVLAAAQQEVDLRVDAEVPGHNPDVLDPPNYTPSPSIDESLVAFLDDVPPEDARRLQVSGLPDTQAWSYQNHLYVRTDAQAQYPAYFSSVRSTSGKAVYRFDSRQSSVTMLANGRAVTVFIEE